MTREGELLGHLELEPGVDLQKVGRALLAGRAAAVPVPAGEPLWNGITTDPPRPGEPIAVDPGGGGRVVATDIFDGNTNDPAPAPAATGRRKATR